MFSVLTTRGFNKGINRMNERLTQLAKEARYIRHFEFSETQLEKFAKLIVQECVDYAFANGDDVDYLKQYFGIDE